jgi:hypothetical protein
LNLPNFIIVGVAKAGTTALYRYMNEHPEIYMSPEKETNYFAYNGKNKKTFLQNKTLNVFKVRTFDEYKNLFINANGKKFIGEASPIYFESKTAPARIKELLPEVKLIIILRNPSERAFSDYMMHLREGDEIRAAKNALSPESHYVQVGFYYDSLKNYFELFPKENIFIGLYDDLKTDSKKFVQRIYRFLNIDDNFEPNINKKYNVGGYPRSLFLSQLLGIIKRTSIVDRFPSIIMNFGKKIKRINAGNRIEMPEDIRLSLVEIYRNDIINVQELIGIDIKHWLK